MSLAAAVAAASVGDSAPPTRVGGPTQRLSRRDALAAQMGRRGTPPPRAPVPIGSTQLDQIKVICENKPLTFLLTLQEVFTDDRIE